MDVDRVSDMDKEMGGKERKEGSILSQLTEQRMIDQMSILDKFYERYDSQQWGAVLEMELEVSCYCCLLLRQLVSSRCCAIYQRYCISLHWCSPTQPQPSEGYILSCFTDLHHWNSAGPSGALRDIGAWSRARNARWSYGHANSGRNLRYVIMKESTIVWKSNKYKNTHPYLFLISEICDCMCKYISELFLHLYLYLCRVSWQFVG